MDVINNIVGLLCFVILFPLFIIRSVTDQNTLLILQLEIITVLIPAYAPELGFAAGRKLEHIIISG